MFRADVTDTVAPYLWSDEEIMAYMNDAYFMFVRLTGGVPDTTSDATIVSVSAGEATSELHKAVLVIREARLTSSDAPIRIINAQDVNSLTNEDYGILRSSRRNQIGAVHSMVIGEQRNMCRFINIPVVDDEVSLLIDRLPLIPLTEDDQELVDVDDWHHLHLLRWMQHLAYRKQDAETLNPKKAQECEEEFTKYCAQVKREKDRYKHKVRVVAYGGL